jgi:aryl-alcohol dehydrogenase-like predicted oxidoreductase
MIHITRRDLAMLATTALMARTALAQSNEAPPIIRSIPRTGERIPAVGLGTAYGFDRNDEQTRRAATLVVRTLIESGGQLIDTASTYGDAESVLGSMIGNEGFRDKLFIAKTAKVDLLQLHNVRNRRQSLAQFKAWKAQGVCRYVGVTSTFHGDFPAMEAVIVREQPDFVQIDYSLGDREAQKRILPLVAEIKAGVLTAQPFGSGRLFRAVRGRTIPDWAKDFAGSWAQFFLKYLLADDRVTAVIPGTSNPAHMADNLGAMRGRLPDHQTNARGWWPSSTVCRAPFRRHLGAAISGSYFKCKTIP